MKFYKIAKEDLFEGLFDDYKPSKVVKIDPPKTEQRTLTLYRGFDADIENLEKSGDGYILSPEKCEGGVLWFSQDLSEAQGRGEWILKYPLTATRHYQRKYSEDGTYFDTIPEDILKNQNPIEDSKIYGSYELPDGWLWSSKNAKPIISTKPITVTKNMIQKDKEFKAQ